MNHADATRWTVTVRGEQPSDGNGIRGVHVAAFDTAAEADLVDALRQTDAWLPGLSLVAVSGDDIVGHLLLSRAQLDTGVPVLALAPMAVQPSHQRQGIGGRLVNEALTRARATQFPFVIVLGHDDYYPRFGFAPARPMGVLPPFDVPDEVWMALRLPACREDTTGTVVYPPAFDAV